MHQHLFRRVRGLLDQRMQIDPAHEIPDFLTTRPPWPKWGCPIHTLIGPSRRSLEATRNAPGCPYEHREHCQPHGVGRRLSAHPWARVPKANQIQIVKMIRTIGPTIVAVPRNLIATSFIGGSKRCQISLFSPCETFYCLPKICSLQPPKGSHPLGKTHGRASDW